LRTLLLNLAIVLAVTALAQDKPLPPAEAPGKMTLPPGFQATLFAGEPDVVQPIAFTFDDRGRLWVVECLSYPDWSKDGKGKDRVVIFEDNNGDGRHDTRTVFLDNGSNLTGIALGHGGVWLCSLPNLLFIPDRNGDDQPDGPAQLLLDGWSLECKHNVFNSLIWGPDGWLYGCNGITATSHVGKPGTPAADRIPMNCGVWRIHPVHKNFEPVAWGTTNPWGLDFDAFGEMFITNCVLHHIWHVVPGAHFERMYGQDLNPHSYKLMASCADHIHWAGGPWQSARGGSKHHDYGGGHAHTGCMIYLGDNWPTAYRGGVFMCNIHGNRINHDRIERRGSGYVAKHDKDFLLANDTWFRGLAIQYGPDGGVFISDWCDTGECHDYEDIHRNNGRIYKITHGKPKQVKVDLARLNDTELVQLHLYDNEWFVRRARRLLHERAIAGKLGEDAAPALLRMFNSSKDVTLQLRALWTLYVIEGIDERGLVDWCGHADENVRAWAVRLLVDMGKPSPKTIERLTALAGEERSPFVRNHLASALQRIPAGRRWSIAEKLAVREEDARDALIPFMLWYGIEPLPAADPDRAVKLLGTAKMPLVRECIARRVANLDEKSTKGGLPPLIAMLGRTQANDIRRDVLLGMREALRGRREHPMPKGWADLAVLLNRTGLADVREHVQHLSVVFGDKATIAGLQQALADAAAPTRDRQKALELLAFKQTPGLAKTLQTLIADKTMSAMALRALAAYDDPATPEAILKHYTELGAGEKADAVATLCSRQAYALALLEAVEKKRVPRTDLSPVHLRQMQTLKDKQVTARLTEVWGTIRPAARDKTAQARKLKDFLTEDTLKKANLANGRLLYAKHCATCHKLFDEGKSLGPDLTGSQRANLDYILENLLDPSALVPQDYQITVVMTRGGRALNGLLTREDDASITIATQNESVDVPKRDIAQRARLPQSFMPDGLLDALKPDEVRDLIGYLASPAQAPLPGRP
jgi:putative membrane-bound dehydrogenase-like protein